MPKNSIKNLKGFTLIELIIVIAIISILAAAIFVAIDPARRLNESRNARRYSDITTILDAVVKYQADNEGTHYSTVAAINAGEIHQIGTCANGASASCTAEVGAEDDCVDLSGLGTNYLATTPTDPRSGTDAITDYYITRDANNSITVGACEPEGEGAGGGGATPDIELSR